MRPAIEGAVLTKVDAQESRQWLAYVVAGKAAPRALGARAWMIWHGDDGVTWGSLASGVWQLGSAAFPELSPPPDEDQLHEFRVFSPTVEVLIWKAGGQLSGRMLQDADGYEGVCPPLEGQRLLAALVPLERRGDFTRVGDGLGAEQALPLKLEPGARLLRTPRLRIKEYYQVDNQTGEARVAASRLLELV